MMSFNKFIIREVIFADHWVKIAKEKVILQKNSDDIQKPQY